jgi:hypothetical protein
MRRSFKQGICVGIVAPLAFMGGIVWWIYRYTGKVPFPVARSAEGELTMKLVDPQEVPAYWEQWKQDLMPLCEKTCALGRELKARYWDPYLGKVIKSST